MTTTDLDPTRIEEFAGRMGGLLNDALLSLSISLGHQTGLFDTMAELPPSTSAEIAKAADLDERYVREVLGALTTGGITTYDADLGTYALPAEHAALLTRAAGVGNMAALTQFVAMLGVGRAGHRDLLPRRRGRAVREVPDLPPADGRAVEGDRSTPPSSTAPSASSTACASGSRPGIDVADIGCGAGYAMNVLGRAFPNSRFTGFDFSEEAIAAARAQAEEWGLTNVTFEVRDVAEPRHHRALRPRDRLRRHPRPGRPGGGAPGHRRTPSGPTACSSASTWRRRATSRTTSTTRSDR